MSRKVKHVHADSNEYVKVHRTQGSKDSGMSIGGYIFIILAYLLCAHLFISGFLVGIDWFWKLVLCCFMSGTLGIKDAYLGAFVALCAMCASVVSIGWIIAIVLGIRFLTSK